jgi:hypothetical protein
MQNHPYSKFGPIFIPINRFDFQGLVLSSYLISMIMHLPRIHLCHMIFHSLHYHFLTWDHLLIFPNHVFDPTQISDHLPCSRFTFLHTFKFWTKSSRDSPMPYFSSSWSTLPFHTLVGIFWNLALINVRWFWALVKTISTLSFSL